MMCQLPGTILTHLLRCQQALLHLLRYLLHRLYNILLRTVAHSHIQQQLAIARCCRLARVLATRGVVP